MNTASAVALSKLRDNVGLAYRGDGRAVDLLLTALCRAATCSSRTCRASERRRWRGLWPQPRSRLPSDPVHQRHAAGRRSGDLVFHAPNDRFEFHPARSSPTSCSPRDQRARRRRPSRRARGMNETAVTVESERRPLPQPFMSLPRRPGRVSGHVPAARVPDGPLLPPPVPGIPRRTRRRAAAARRHERVLAAIRPCSRPPKSSRSRRRPKKWRRRPAPRLIQAIVKHRGRPRSCGSRFPRAGAGVLPAARPRPSRRARVRHAGQRPGRREAGPREPDPVCFLRRIRAGGREKEIVRKILSQVLVPV